MSLASVLVAEEFPSLRSPQGEFCLLLTRCYFEYWIVLFEAEKLFEGLRRRPLLKDHIQQQLGKLGSYIAISQPLGQYGTKPFESVGYATS